jgi:hypothetical protein
VALPISSKLPLVESKTLAHDSRTTRKSAPFRARANLEPLCCPLQAAFRFFRTPIPAPPTARLTACLPSIRYTGTKARNRAYHVPFHADPHPRGSIRLAPACFPMALRRRAPTCQESNLPFTFWSKPDSSFGLFVFTEFQTAIHLRCAYGTCLAFTPPRCLQCRSPRRRGEPSFEKYVVPGASNPTVTSHACPGRQLLVAQQVTDPESQKERTQG